MRIRVVFLQDVPPKYLAGEVREVAAGFARNYLIPGRLAAPALPQHLQGIEKIKKAAGERRRRESQDMEVLAQSIQGMTVAIQARAGEGGRLYGSVSSATIAAELSKALEREIDRRAITLSEPIKELGTYQVPVRLYMNIAPVITLVVESPKQAQSSPGKDEAPTAKADEQAEEGENEEAAAASEAAA